MNNSNVISDDKTWREKEVEKRFLVMNSWCTQRVLGQKYKEKVL